MRLIILIYFIIGILSCKIGPIARFLNEKFKESKGIPIINPSSQKPKTRRKVEIATKITMRIIVVLIFPLLYFLWAYDYFRPSQKNINSIPIKVDNYLYFSRMKGKGKIHCNECGFEEKIVSFLHGFGQPLWTNTGFQCQNCGMFHQIEFDSNNSKGVKCECGGNLDNQKPLFCPKCRTKNMSYYVEYLT